MPAVRALLVALDEWVARGERRRTAACPGSMTERWCRRREVAFPAIPGSILPHAANDAPPPGDWTDPVPASRAYVTLVPQVDADGNERAGIRLPDIAVPRGTFTGWNLYAAPYPEGELADRDGSFLAFANTAAERGNDPRPSLAERYPGIAYADTVRTVTQALLNDRLLLREDAERYVRRDGLG